jgi:broad specificity phosphatase PhoE
MTRWWWVRHGPTHQKNLVGWRDVPADLSDVAKIDRLRQALPQDAVILSSDLMRAHDTANAITTGQNRLTSERDLREFNFGEWDGLHFSQISERDKALSRAFWEQPGDTAPPGGESWNALAQRVGRVVDRINADNPETDVIAVAHFGVILTQLQRGLGTTAYQTLAHTIDPLSVTVLVHEDGRWHVDRINHQP